MIQFGISWPIAIVDFEASSLEDQSYPIEVGVATWSGAAKPIHIWSSLIEPTSEWVRDGIWTWEAQQIHGITPHDLIGAPKPRAVVDQLIRRMGASTSALSDNPTWDAGWLERLSDAAGMPAPFGFSRYSDHLIGMTSDDFERAVKHSENTPRPHRAADDALRLMTTFAVGIGIDPIVVRG